MPTILLLVLGLVSVEFLGQAPHKAPPQTAAPSYRYFKEDHLTGAKYLWLRDNGDYTIVGREHMGIFQLEGGRWTKHGSRLTFTPTRKSGGLPLKPYAATEVRHGKHTFLGMEPDDPALKIPIAETLKEFEGRPGRASAVRVLRDRPDHLRERDRAALPVPLHPSKCRRCWLVTPPQRSDARGIGSLVAPL
jgi:hypothetical protein